MTYDEMKALAFGGHYSPPAPVLCSPCPEFEVQPRPEDRISHVQQSRPMTEADTNGLSIQDAKDLHGLRVKDQLHKVDTVAAMANAGNLGKSKLKTEGTQKFSQRYNK